MGLRLSDDFAGRNGYQLIGEANFTGLNDYGGESRNRVELGRITGAHAEYYQPFGKTGEFFVAPYLEYSAFNFPLSIGGRDTAEYRRSRALAAAEIGYTPNASWRLSGTLEFGHDRAHLRVGDNLPDFSSDVGGVLLRVTRDNLDDSGFPTRGTRLDLAQEFLLPQLGSDDSATITRLRWDTALSASALDHFLIGGALSSAGGGDTLIAAYSPLGGLGNLSGFTESQLFARQTALLRGVYYRRM